MLKAEYVRQAWATKAGVADLLICYNGRFIAIECKDNEGTATKQQEDFNARIIAAGGKAAVCRTLKECYDLVVSDGEI